jgi:hypothetical protein
MAIPTRELLRHFDELHRSRFDVPAVIVAGKDAAIVTRLWKTHGEYMRPLMARFFSERGEFQERAGFTVGVFASQFARLLMDYHKQERKAGLRDFSWEDECRRTCKEPCQTAYQHSVRKPVAS